MAPLVSPQIWRYISAAWYTELAISASKSMLCFSQKHFSPANWVLSCFDFERTAVRGAKDVKYFLMGISVILFLWVGTFFLMLE